MKKKISIFIISIISLFLFTQTIVTYPETLENLIYEHELIKFYINQDEFELAISIADSIYEESFYQDSLKYFKGLAYNGLKDWESSSSIFSDIFINGNDEDLIPIVKKEFNKSIKKLGPTKSIEKITAIIDSIDNVSKHPELFLTMAEIYEENQLFEEANEAYKFLLDDLQYDKILSIKLKIATNDIFLKDYQHSADLLKSIIESEDSLYIEDALFFSYIANSSINNFPEAKKSLLRLYLEFPAHRNRFEIIEGLVGLYENFQEYLMCWYLLNELYEISSETQKFNIHLQIDRIKKLLVQDTLTVDQFKNFKPVFEEIEEPLN